MVKRLRHRPFTAVTRVRFPSESFNADVAQLAEQLICNQQVAGSIPIASSIFAKLGRNCRGFEFPSLCSHGAGPAARPDAGEGNAPSSGCRWGEIPRQKRGGVPEWPKGTDCKSVVARLRWFKSTPHHQLYAGTAVGDSARCQGTTASGGNSSTARASAFQAEGCEFESRFPLHSCHKSFLPPSVATWPR